MAAAEKRTFSLPREQAEYIERWLREEVVPVATATRADPSRAIPADQVFDEIRAFHAQRARKA